MWPSKPIGCEVDAICCTVEFMSVCLSVSLSVCQYTYSHKSELLQEQYMSSDPAWAACYQLTTDEGIRKSTCSYTYLLSHSLTHKV